MKLSKPIRFLVAGAMLAGGALATHATADAASANLFAQVSGTGSLIHGNNVSSVTHIGAGRYEVTFTQNVSACAYVSTTALNPGQSVQSYTAGGHLSANGVYVEVKNQGGGLTDLGFSLAVNCGGSNLKYAVVGTTGSLVRGSAGTTVTSLGTGKYRVAFGSSVASCSYLATVGDPANSTVVNPAGVYTGSSTTVGDVYIETKNPGGGLTAGIPFHLSVVCPGAASTRIDVFAANGFSTRANGGTGSFRQSTGSYVVVSNLAETACVTIATRGSINTAVPFDPATVEVSAGPVSNTEIITVRNLLALGGALENEAVHSAVFC